MGDMGSVKLSVVLPCYNSAATIAEQIEALASQSWHEPWELIVSDNGSTDGTMSIVEGFRDRFECLKMVDSSDKKGPAHARNIGALAAAGEALAFCDSDDEVGPEWVARMGKALSKYDFVAGSLLVERLNQDWSSGYRGSFQSEKLQKIWFPPYLPHAATANLGIKRSIHDGVNGFDESLRCLEDTDYCFKVQLSGVNLHFVQDAKVYYRYRKTLRGVYRQSRDYAQGNMVLADRYKEFEKSTGSLSVGWRKYFYNLVKLLKLLPRVRNKKSLAKVIWLLGWQIGLLKGSLRHKMPPV